MEDYKDQFILILAGYFEEMNFFLQTNPGLPSRFPIQIDFPDYNLDQLMAIAEMMIKERDYSLIPQTELKLRQHLAEEKNNPFHVFSNARCVRNLIEKSLRQQAVRLLHQQNEALTKQDLMILRPEDFNLGHK